MVDLVKIRRKAKKAAAALEPQPDEQAVVATPAPDPLPPERGAEPQAAKEPEHQETISTSAITDETAAMASVTDDRAVNKLERFKQEAGRRRDSAAGPAAQAEDGGETRTLELLTFVMAGEHYAADIERIVEIITPRPATRVPNADHSVVGIMSLRGTIVALIDVRRRLRLAASREETPDTRIIVVEQQGEHIGFEVDRVLRVVKIGSDAIEPHPIVHATESDESILGVFRHTDALTILLDLDKLLAAGGTSGRTLPKEKIASRG